MEATIASAIHGTSSEVIAGILEGLKYDSAIHLDHIQPVKQACPPRFLGPLPPQKMRETCRAPAIAFGCDV